MQIKTLIKVLIKSPKFKGTIFMTPRNLLILTFIAVIATYLFVFGQTKTIELIKAEYLALLALIPIIFTLLFFKLKLKNFEIINFTQNSTPSLQSTIMFFLVFQVVDYISEDGFIGMISQWFLYWVMGLIALLLMHTINYYKNYKISQKINNT